MLSGGERSSSGIGSWDKGLDYERAYQEILKHLLKTENPRDVFLLVQLTNGSRIGEAVEAVRKACQGGQGPGAEVRVRVEKRKDNAERLIVIPTVIPKRLLEGACHWLEGVEDPSTALSIYSLRTYGFNTHSLRYAFITKMVKNGVQPSVIAKITGHKTLSHIITYTEAKEAEEILRRMAKG